MRRRWRQAEKHRCAEWTEEAKEQERSRWEQGRANEADAGQVWGERHAGGGEQTQEPGREAEQNAAFASSSDGPACRPYVRQVGAKQNTESCFQYLSDKEERWRRIL